MQSDPPDYKALISQAFKRAAFVQDVGIEFVDCGPGWCETRLLLATRHHQQTDVVHAGVLATLADHTAGGAAGTQLQQGEYILTIEFKVNLLRAARGESLRCRAEVLKPGRMFSVVESQVYALSGEESPLVAKATVTLAVLKKSNP